MLTDVQAYCMTFLICLFPLVLTAAAICRKAAEAFNTFKNNRKKLEIALMVSMIRCTFRVTDFVRHENNGASNLAFGPPKSP